MISLNQMKNKTYKISTIALTLFAVPFLALAAFPSNLGGVIEMFTDIGMSLIPFLGAVAFLVFVWGVARFIKSAGSEKEIKDSKNMLIWGVIGLFVLVTIWGIIAFLSSEFGFGSGTPGIPQIPSNIV
jgi:hypothetical protein